MLILLPQQANPLLTQHPPTTHLTSSASSYKNPTIFETTWGGQGYDEAYGTALDSAGNIYVTGDTQSFCCGSLDAFLLKFNSTGSLLWQRAWPGTNQFGAGTIARAHAIALDSTGDAYITGYTQLNYTSPTALLLVKFDPNGNLLWQKRIGGSQSRNQSSLGNGITISPSGSIYVTGYIQSPPNGNQALLALKFSSNGTLIWQTAWTKNTGETGTAIAADAAENIYVAGSSVYQSTGILLKLNSSGSILWQKQVSVIGNSGNTVTPINALTLDPAGNGYITGTADIHTNSSNTAGIPILKFNPNGTLAWERLLHAGSTFMPAIANGIAVDSNGNIELTGQFNTIFNNTSPGILLAQLSNDGTLAWETTRGQSPDAGRSVALDANHNLIIVGSVYEAPPYPPSALADQLTSNNFILQYVSGYLVTPNATSKPQNLTVITPTGSQSYSGQGDAYILKTQPPQPMPPSPPGVLVAQGYSSNITLSWNRPLDSGSHSITGYRVYRGLSAGTEKPLVNISTTRRYIDLDVRSGNTYYYYVTAENGVGESSASNEGSATIGTPSNPLLLAVPIAGIGGLLILFIIQRRRKHLRIKP